MPIQPAEVVRVDWVGDFNQTDQIVNTFQFRLDSGVTLSEAEALVDFIEILEGLHTIIEALLSALYVVRRIRAQNVTTGQLVGEMAFDPVLVGSSVSQVAATQMAAVINFPTLTPRVIGRKFLGPIAENVLDENGLLASSSNSILESAAQFLVGAHVQSNGTWTFGYVSGKTGLFEEFNTYSVAQAPGTQRRRRIGRGV